MSQAVITTAFEQLKAQQAASGAAVVLDGFIFANVPNLDITTPIDPAEAIPTAAQIVHRADVTLTGVVNDNAVVYSVTLGTAVGDFDFNWVGLVNKASNTLAMIVHAPAQNKVANAAGVQGNVLTRSFLMEYDGAKKQTEITTPAATWQIDFTARLGGIDERLRVENVDTYGQGAFFGDGFLVKQNGNNYSVTAGSGYVGGLRASIASDQVLTVTTKPMKVWVDTCFTGTLTSVWQVQTIVTVADAMADYVKNDVKHYVFAVAQINADGSVTDLRKIGSDTDDRLAKHIANPDAHPQYAPTDSPVLSGKPTAPTAAAGTNTTQLANTAFVHAAIAALVNSSPEALDTLKELSEALGNDANFAATMTAALAAKQPLDATLTAIAALTGAADKLFYFNGNDSAALTALTAFAREILAQTDAAGVRSKLDLGNAATQGVATNADMQAGTSTGLIPTVAAVMSIFSKRSFSQNDFIRIPDVPGGLMIQWGLLTGVSGANVITSTLTFPELFPNACLAVVPIATASPTSGGMCGIQLKAKTRSNADIFIYERDSGAIATHDVLYIAIGW